MHATAKTHTPFLPFLPPSLPPSLYSSKYPLKKSTKKKKRPPKIKPPFCSDVRLLPPEEGGREGGSAGGNKQVGE